MALQGVLLAAGLGTRLRPLTLCRPKALIPLYGIPLIEYGIAHLRAAGCTRIAVNLHHHASMLRNWLLREELRLGVRLELFDEPVLLGTGGGLARIFSELPPGPCLVQNADLIHGFDLAEFVMRARDTRKLSLMCHGEPLVLQVEGEHLRAIGKNKDPNVGFTGISYWTEGARASLSKGHQRDLVVFWLDWMKAGHGIAALRTRMPDPLWEDLGHLHRYLDLHKAIIKRADFMPLMQHLGLTPSWNQATGSSMMRGSSVKGAVRNSVIWEHVKWRGSVENSVVCDTVEGSGMVKGEIVL